jgi:uncharacterized membrane protein
MAQANNVFIYVGTYPNVASAQGDYQIVKNLHSEKLVGDYDAAVVTKDPSGKVHVSKDETATRHGAWGGAAVGAVAGILFPPSIIATTIVGAGIGAVSGHLWKGMSRSDVKELGDIIDTGQAALLVVGESKVEQQIEKAVTKAEKHAVKELQNVSSDQLNAAVAEAAREAH